MKLTNLKISTQLKLAFGSILILIVGLGAISWQQSHKLAQQTTDLFEHPFTVRMALDELNADILSMRLEFRNFLLAKNEQERQEALSNTRIRQENAEKQFEILLDRYLGPKSDINSAHEAFLRWLSVREGNVELGRNGEVEKAMDRVESTGDIGKERQELMNAIQKIDNFARNKANEFYVNAESLKSQLNFQLALVILGMLGLTIFITYYLNWNIRKPIDELVHVTTLFGEGNLGIRSQNSLLNEFGQLSNAFNQLADTIEDELNVRDKAASLAEVMLSEDEAHQFCLNLLSALIQKTEAQLGAVYLLNEEKTQFEPFECLGMANEGLRPFSAVHFEGEFGAALASRKIQHIFEIPDDSRFMFSTISGQFVPKEIITIPIVSGNESVAVISLASVKSFGPESIRVINFIASTLNARMGGIMAYRKMIEFSQQLESQNEQMAIQQEELAEANAYNRSLLEASVDSLVTIAPDGRIMDVNHATEMFTGRSRKELIGTDVSIYFTEPERAKAGYEKVFREEVVRDYELAIQKADGTVIPVLYNASVYRDNAGQVIGVLAAARDISERKRAEEEMRILNKELKHKSETLSVANQELQAQRNELSAQASELTEQNLELETQKNQLDEVNRLKTIFLSNMSHELRTPLNSVIALSGVLNRRLSGKVPDEEYSYIDIIERNGKQLLALINDILDLSRIEAGHEEIELQRFDAKMLIREVAELIEPQARQKDIPIVFNTNGETLEIESDYVKCRHILQNLVANAVKFTDDGLVEINASFQDHTIQISVKDTGIGIAKDHLDHIFDEFRQADGSSSRKYGGTGLGLAIAKKYANLLGGTIKVESEVGQGSVFTLTLPLQIASQYVSTGIQYHRQWPAPLASGKSTSPENAAQKTILVVEDSEAAIIQLREMLSSQGYNILLASNGAEALEQIERQLPDAMILDLMMPEVDGFEVLKRIREHPKTERLPVIILTAKYVTKEELAFLRHNSVHQLILKGDVNKEQLLNEVASMMFPEEIKPAVVETPSTIGASRTKEKTPVVLVVEDNPDNMTTIKALLDDRFQVIEAEDGWKGLEMAEKHIPDLILMDIALPGINGIEVLKLLRKNDRLMHIPVLAVTASAMKTEREEFLALGFNGYISKPIDNHIFEEMVANWVGPSSEYESF